MFVSVITNHRFGNGGTRDAKDDFQAESKKDAVI